MNTALYYHREAIRHFEHARQQASWWRLWHIVSRRNNTLVAFDTLRPYLSLNAIPQGIQEIPVGHVVGTVGRQRHTFSRDFLPLREELRQRWSNIYILAMTSGWPPIVAYQVGNLYFVEDGHHRLSVARYLRNPVIEADVRQYPLTATFNPAAPAQKIVEQVKHVQEFACQPACG